MALTFSSEVVRNRCERWSVEETIDVFKSLGAKDNDVELLIVDEIDGASLGI